MTLLRNILIGFVGLITLVIAGIYLSGNGMLLTVFWAATVGGPDLPFDERSAVEPPDYTNTVNWAALPNRDGVEDMIPKGVADTDIQGKAPVDVFFVHPTGFLRGESWTYSLDQDLSLIHI